MEHQGLERYTAYRVSVGLVVVIGWVDVGRIEVQVAGVGIIVGGRGPEVPVGTLIVHAAGVIVVPGKDKGKLLVL